MEKDFLRMNISQLPYFRGLLRAVEAQLYQNITLPEPVLDVGCGDGSFATITFDHRLAVGTDPWIKTLRESAAKKTYWVPVCALGAELPFSDEYFSSVISNSVLEHIEDVQPVLDEIQRVTKPGGHFIFCVPNHKFPKNLSVSRALWKIGLRSFSRGYGRLFNGVSRHKHTDDPRVWEERLARSSFKVINWWHYFSPRALAVLEWGHLFGLPALFCKLLFGRWILLSQKWNLIITEMITRPFYLEDRVHPYGSYTFFIAQKS